ncbi:MAG: LysR family transcriptional regulator [Gammaproteobacteria bacterium]|nr:LysR family transcriptional regulator [Gammaproteobacteria bacterium]
MNIRDIRYLIAVADTLHFGKAADRCFVSQPTLSGQIRKLESELGVEIFERSNRNVAITPEGEQLLEHARQLLYQAEAMAELAETFKDPMAGRIKLGAIPTLSPYLMPRIWLEIDKCYPQAELQLTEAVHSVLLRQLRDRELDFALVSGLIADSQLRTIPLFDEPFWLAHPTRHPIYHKDEINCDDLQQLELLLMSPEHCLHHEALKLCCCENGYREGEVSHLRASSMETLLQLVAAGVGCTLVPALSIGGGWTTDHGINVRKIDMASAKRQVSLVCHHRYHRHDTMEIFRKLIVSRLPNTVKIINAGYGPAHNDGEASCGCRVK